MKLGCWRPWLDATWLSQMLSTNESRFNLKYNTYIVLIWKKNGHSKYSTYIQKFTKYRRAAMVVISRIRVGGLAYYFQRYFNCEDTCKRDIQMHIVSYTRVIRHPFRLMDDNVRSKSHRFVWNLLKTETIQRSQHAFLTKIRSIIFLNIILIII